MNNLGNLFDKDTVENTSNLVESKMYLLNDLEDFRNKDKAFASALEKLESSLSKDSRNILDEMMRLNYQVQDYYFTLAYFLGKQHNEQTKKL